MRTIRVEDIPDKCTDCHCFIFRGVIKRVAFCVPFRQWLSVSGDPCPECIAATVPPGKAGSVLSD
jgi:hypothetical protein